MEHRIQYGPAYTLATLSLTAGESVMAEAGAMVSMSPGLEVQTSASSAGGLLKGLKRGDARRAELLHEHLRRERACRARAGADAPG